MNKLKKKRINFFFKFIIMNRKKNKFAWMRKPAPKKK